MKTTLMLPFLALVFLIGCASPNLQEKYAGWSTSQLQLRRQQLHEEIPDMVITIGIFGKDYEDEKKEKQNIEMELLRRYEAGDKNAELKTLTPHRNSTLRGGNF